MEAVARARLAEFNKILCRDLIIVKSVVGSIKSFS